MEIITLIAALAKLAAVCIEKFTPKSVSKKSKPFKVRENLMIGLHGLNRKLLKLPENPTNEEIAEAGKEDECNK